MDTIQTAFSMPQPHFCLWLFATLRKGLETSAAKQNKGQKLTRKLSKTKKNARNFEDNERFAL